MIICKIQVLFPVVLFHIMFPASHMISQLSNAHRLIHAGHLRTQRAILLIQFVCFTSVKQRQIFPSWIGPLILLGTCHIEGTWCHKCHQHVLVHRKRHLIIIIVMKTGCKPVRKGGVDIAHPFSKGSPGKGGTSTARIVGNYHGKALILRSGPK